jgi:hypothetical protein
MRFVLVNLFCAKVQSLGYKIYVDLDNQAVHYGMVI